jgi:hypothetical protein
MPRAIALLIGLAIFAAAMLSSHQNKPFPLLIDEAQAVTIICNPVFVPNTSKVERTRKVVRT